RQGDRPHYSDPFYFVRAGRHAGPCRASRCTMVLPQFDTTRVRIEPGNCNWGCNNRQFYAQQLANLPRSSPGWLEVRPRALVIRVDLQLRGSCECGHRYLAVQPAAYLLVGRRDRWSCHGRRLELRGYVGSDLARMNLSAFRGFNEHDPAICRTA